MLTVYHGSYEEVKEPSFRMCKSYTDFGLGFYVTENYEMAERWACQGGKSYMKPTNRSFAEIAESARKSFYEANGYYPTEEDCIRLTDEAREEIRLAKEQREKESKNTRE